VSRGLRYADNQGKRVWRGLRRRRAKEWAMARARRAAGVAKNGRQGPSALGFEATLWQAADKLRNSMDLAEYKKGSVRAKLRAMV
jgi:hypothetical protein